MTSRTYSTLDRNRTGPLLLVDLGDMQVTTADTCDINRTILGTLPARSGEYAFEAYFWSVSRASLANLLSIGVAQPDAALDTYVGGDALGYGFRVADGEIHTDGESIATVEPQGERIALGVHLTLAPGEATCEWLVNGSSIYTADLPTGKTWLPAISFGSDSPSDISAIINCGQNRFDTLPWRNGWSIQTAGLATIYLSLATEAYLSGSSETKANQPYGPYLLNGNQVAVELQPRPYALGSGGNPASLTVIRLDNSNGRFDALRRADVKDSTLVLQTLNSPPGGAGDATSAASITRELTGIVEDVSAPKPGVIEIKLRGTLSRMDRPAKMRIIPPFYDPTAAGRVRPIGLGAQRNVQPIYLEKAEDGTLLYLLGDAPMSNIALVTDMGAPLDPNALPPQYTPALSHEGLQLETDPVGRVGVDCSSVGPQYDIPGADDVLDGAGEFPDWDVTEGTPTDTPPDGWEWSDNTDSTLYKFTHGTSVAARIVTARPWYPHPFGSEDGLFGDFIDFPDAVLGGRSYRISFNLVLVNAANPATTTALRGGLMLRTDLSDDPAGAISAHGVAITTPTGLSNRMSIDFRVPYGSARPIYVIATASGGSAAGSHVGTGIIEIQNIRLELLGQSVTIPLDGITATDAFKAILVDREGEDEEVFSASDLTTMDTEAPYVTGYRWEDTPNVLDQLLEICDQYGALLFEDEFGVIRVKRFLMPEDAGSVVAGFTEANVNPDSVRISPAAAPGLTTQWGARINCTPFGDGDFVTDTTVVTAAIRAAYMADSQFAFSTTARPAHEYIARIGGRRRLLRIDDLEDARTEANRVAAQFEQRREIVEFDALHEGNTIGIGTTIAPQQLYPGSLINVDLPGAGLSDVDVVVLGVKRYIGAGRVTITGIY